MVANINGRETDLTGLVSFIGKLEPKKYLCRVVGRTQETYTLLSPSLGRVVVPIHISAGEPAEVSNGGEAFWLTKREWLDLINEG